MPLDSLYLSVDDIWRVSFIFSYVWLGSFFEFEFDIYVEILEAEVFIILL
jgi:hypothetical protein